MAEKFCLKWNDFNSNVSKSFGFLRNEDFLHDVTLVGDDYKQISAHKFVLSTCSQYFKNIFKNQRIQPYQHPLICLSGISSGDLNNILDYIYEGEVQIYQVDLDRFLDIAQRLKLDGLLANEDNTIPDFIDTNIMDESKPIIEYDVGMRAKLEQEDIQMEATTIGTVAVNSEYMSSIDEKIKEYITKGADKNYKCTLCGKIAKKISHIKNHIETHLDGLEFPCQPCDKTFRSRVSLGMHKSKFHKNAYLGQEIC